MTADDPAHLPADRAAAHSGEHPRHAPAALHQAARHGQRFLSAYSGEHGVYGVVLVSALIGVAADDDTDYDTLVFVLGTVLVFWIAHIYAAVVAGRSRTPRERLPRAVAEGARHASGMLIAMLVPALLLSLGAVNVLEDRLAFELALASGVVVLGLIGYYNAVRNGSSWRWRVGGALTTMLLGVLVIALSILAH